MSELRLPERRLDPQEMEEFGSLVRAHLGWGNQLVPDLVKCIEHQMHSLVPEFQWHIASDAELHWNKAKTDFDPLLMTLSNSVYKEAAGLVPKARFDVAHELGHVLLHSKIARPKRGDTVYRGQTSNVRAASNIKFRVQEGDASNLARILLLPRTIVDRFADFLELAEECAVPEDEARKRFVKIKKPDLRGGTLDWLEEMKKRNL